jgi:hypothetical protein
MKETMNKPYVVYANKLLRFLYGGTYDNDTLCLLGVIAAKSRRKHVKLEDGIKTAIADLLLENADGMILVTRASIL